jgi:hypothetical protein
MSIYSENESEREKQPEAKPISVPSDSFEFNCPYVASGETTLRCSKCNRPLMAKDAVRTPTGYVCPYYVKARVATFYNARVEHYVIVAIASFVLGLVAGFILNFLSHIGFFAIILVLFGGPIIGGVVAEIIRRVMGRTRGQYFWLTAATGMVIGAAYFTILPALFGFLLTPSINALFTLIPILGLGLAVSTLIARMRI